MTEKQRPSSISATRTWIESSPFRAVRSKYTLTEWVCTSLWDQRYQGSPPRSGPADQRRHTSAVRHPAGAWTGSGASSATVVTLLDDLQAIGVDFVSLAEGIDATTPAGRLQLHILGAIAEFERARTVERVRAGLARARAQGKTLGRPRVTRVQVPRGLTVRGAAHAWGVSKSTAATWLNQGRVPSVGQTPPPRA